MEALMKKQKSLKQEILTFEKNFRKTSKTRHTEGYLNGRINGINELWATFRINHEQINELATEENENLEYFTDETYETTEELVYNLKGDFSDALETLKQKKVTVHVSEPARDLKLPRIDIPRFSGSYQTWASFRDLFESLVHNNPSLTDVQKLHYLKANLSGEAQQILRHYSITEANYRTAWQTLLDRYDNKRMLVDAQLSLLMSIPAIPKENFHAIKSLLDTTNECLQSLNNLKIQVDSWDPIIIYITVKKLPQETYRLWESKFECTKELQTFKDLQQFLEGRFQTLQRIAEQQKAASREHPVRPQHNNSSRNVSNVLHITKALACALCKQGHTIRQCSEFLKLNANQKQEIAKSKSLCLNCLSHRHSTNKCASNSRCYICDQNHHTLLHTSFSSDVDRPTVNHGVCNEIPNTYHTSLVQESSKNIHTYLNSSHKWVLLATALIQVNSITGQPHVLRALIDQGSQASFITESAAQRLQLKRNSTRFSITGLNVSEPIRSTGSIKICFHSRTGRSCPLHTEVIILRTITNLLPPSTIQNHEWTHLNGLELADPEFWKPGGIDVLLGADVYARILLNGLKAGPYGTPIAQQTVLGWILSGPIVTNSDNIKRNIVSMHNRIDIDLLLRSFWEVEELQGCRTLTEEEKECEAIFERTYARTTDGRFTVKLPFRHSSGHSQHLGKSRDLAMKRFIQLENKLKRNPELYEEYCKCMKEYLDLGHMSPVTTSESSHAITLNKRTFYSSCYLPHHCVLKENSSTTKLRVVFDASARTSTGVSLNDELLVGPSIQQELMQILMRWRVHKVAFTADIAKMYRQILVASEDAEYQRVLWRFHPNDELKDYKLRTVTFGTSSAPYLAVKTLHQLAKDNTEGHPLASKVVLRDFYVDDLMSGSDTIPEALELQTQLISLLQSGGFELRKWTCNEEQLLKSIPENYREVQLPLHIKTEATVKTLGVLWNPVTDYFNFKITLESIQHLTKRTMLSDIARLFDPLGWISPVIVTAKIMMQKLWLKGLTWDEEISGDLARTWNTYRGKLKDLETIQIPRWLSTHSTDTICEIHGFCDASEQAYAAAVYLKSTNSRDTVISLLISKTKVAPIKRISLPRLELCGAVLLARLVKKIIATLNLSISATHAWTDSMIVLAWIRGHPSRWKSFVANRTTEIHASQRPEVWHHIASQENPADCATRGMDPEALKNHTIWWNGPNWLIKNNDNWPNKETSSMPDTNLEERKTTSLIVPDLRENLDIFERFSNLTKLIRTVAHCKRFIHNARSFSSQRLNRYLTYKELQDALHSLVKMAQDNEFHAEIYDLKTRKQVEPKSRIISLTPFLDATGLLRVGGRLREADLNYNEKHPIILSGSHPLTKLIIDNAHKTTLHGGPQLMLAFLRKKYWILNARDNLSRHVHRCTICFKQRSQTVQQLMGDLPRPRLLVTRPFTNVGIDYAGPVNIRISKGKGNKSHKGYVALFICLCTKAVHIEAVSDLTTNAFLAAFRRFSSRRGLPKNIHSDCGTNFVGANKALTLSHIKSMRNLNEEIASLLANNGIEWHFNPPASPHFGGLWEAGIKSMKYHMKRILQNTTLTYEELTTILHQIEACLNSRPLCPISNDPTDLSVLTPGHFLMGTSPLTPPEEDISDRKLHSLTRWQLLQHLYQGFWKKWNSEYLSRLQQRPKWLTRSSNLEKGNVILIKDSNTLPCKWLLGRIEETHPGKDGLVRVVTVRTSHGLLKRPVTKICLLPIPDNDNNRIQNP